MSENAIRISAQKKIDKIINLEEQIDVLKEILFGENSKNDSVRYRNDMLEKLAILEKERKEVLPESVEELKMMNQLRILEEA